MAASERITPRILDLDLDFFVHGVEHYRTRDGGRLDSEDYPAWSIDEAMTFLTDQCGLTGKLPGCAVEFHGELFSLWREALDQGVLDAPFDIVHVDAHADLGLGEAAWIYLLKDLITGPFERRRFPKEGDGFLTDGNYLSFAVGCRWIESLTYVYNRGGGSDILSRVMEGLDVNADHIQLAPISESHYEAMLGGARIKLPTDEPRVPFRTVRWDEFRTGDAFDVVCLARSPEYTPPEADSLFAAIRDVFIDEQPWTQTKALRGARDA